MRQKKEDWGFAYVRDYSPTDELGSNINLSGLSPEEMKEKAAMLLKMSETKKTEDRQLSKAEKEYIKLK